MPSIRVIQTTLSLCAVGIVVYWLMFSRSYTASNSHENQPQRVTINQEAQDRVREIQNNERYLSDSLWADEYLAQHLGRSIEHWWDRINASSPKMRAVGDIGIDTIISIKHWVRQASVPHLNIEQSTASGNNFTFNQSDWKEFISTAIRDGWELENIEFRHLKFNPPVENTSQNSEFFIRAGISDPNTNQRCLLKGTLKIHWKDEKLPVGDINQIEKIDAHSIEMISTSTHESFKLIHSESINPPENADSIDPLLVHDIDGDGVSEIILANKNKLLRYHSDGYFTSSPLCTFHPGLLSTAIFADLNGDGWTDFLCHRQEGLVVIPGDSEGLFDQYPIMLRPSNHQTVYPMVLSVGDVDRDGDLDIFLGQYRVPYQGGALPTPFYDADDGHPFFLLRNVGDWQFEDITNASLPESKRHRRVYSASLVDLDGVNGLDLVVVSDFAGADLYLNDGKGIFHNASERLCDSYGFGMAHAISDFNVDGKLDLLMIGMTSPTVDRLEHLNLWRPGLTLDRTLRNRMAVGNRLFLSAGNGGFEQKGLSQTIANAGWAWGCSSADFDNNGYPDVIIGNGLETRKYVQDYEPEYWLHDAFIANSERNPAAYLYFKEKFAQTRGKGHSYGGYESNRLYMNFEGHSFLDVGHLWGLGLQRDTRNVVTEDFNGDGLVDCLFTHFEKWPNENQVLKIYLNQLNTPSNWIGFQMVTGPRELSPLGVSIEIRTENSKKVATIISGDSYRSQHAQTIHFGIGAEDSVFSAIITWPNGRQMKIDRPGINKYHPISSKNAAPVPDHR